MQDVPSEISTRSLKGVRTVLCPLKELSVSFAFSSIQFLFSLPYVHPCVSMSPRGGDRFRREDEICSATQHSPCAWVQAARVWREPPPLSDFGSDTTVVERILICELCRGLAFPLGNILNQIIWQSGACHEKYIILCNPRSLPTLDNHFYEMNRILMLSLLFLIKPTITQGAMPTPACYDINQIQDPTRFPCDPSGVNGLCCLFGETCYSNGLCGPGAKSAHNNVTPFFIGGCTNSLWETDSCPKLCGNNLTSMCLPSLPCLH